MLAAMASRRLTFDQLREVAGRADATTAQHLRVIREAGLVDVARVDGKVTYRTASRSLRADAAWLAGLAGLDGAAKPRRKSA
jgi:DNA-binding transcriptional ArsR family regulator